MYPAKINAEEGVRLGFDRARSQRLRSSLPLGPGVTALPGGHLLSADAPAAMAEAMLDMRLLHRDGRRPAGFYGAPSARTSRTIIVLLAVATSVMAPPFLCHATRRIPKTTAESDRGRELSGA